MKYFWILITGLIFLSGNILHAQEANFPRDTSYTIQSAYQKYVKDYPDISVADPELDDEILIRENITYKNTGNRDLRLDVFTPTKRDTEALPAVLMVHGGGWITGNKSLLHPMAKVLAAKGFVAVTVEYRLSPEAKYPAAVHDVKSSLKWLKDHASDFHIDSGRIAILGTSAGGQLAALVGSTAKNLRFEDPADSSQTSTEVKAIVDIDGVLAFIHPVSKEGTVAGKWLGGNQQEARDKWIEASALTHIDENTPPMLFIGSSYPRFLAGREDVINILDEQGIKHQTHIFDEAPHSFWLFHPWFEPTMEYTVAFLKDVLAD